MLEMKVRTLWMDLMLAGFLVLDGIKKYGYLEAGDSLRLWV